MHRDLDLAADPRGGAEGHVHGPEDLLVLQQFPGEDRPLVRSDAELSDPISIRPGGTQLTLEDGSRWDIDPRQYFAVANWQPDDLISIRREESDPDFSFEVDNTTQDDGSLANFRIR